MFTPGREVWTGEAANDLHIRLARPPATTSSRFFDRLADRLAGASWSTIQLAAELIFVHLLGPADLRGRTKLALIQKTLDLSPDGVEVPAEFIDSLENGITKAGMAYRRHRDQQLLWLVRFVLHWKSISDERRRTALRDPWAFREEATAFPTVNAHSQLNLVLHLVYPEAFEPVVSRAQKQQILDAFVTELPVQTGDVDQDLIVLRATLERQHQRRIDFHAEDLAWAWRHHDVHKVRDSGMQGWILRREAPRDSTPMATWLAEGYCAFSHSDLAAAPPRLLWGRRRSPLAEAYSALGHYMAEGDVIVTADADDVYVGLVSAGSVTRTTAASGAIELRRPVRWLNSEAPVDAKQLPGTVGERLNSWFAVEAIPQHLATSLLEFTQNIVAARSEKKPMTEEVHAMQFPVPTPDLADGLFIDHAWLVEMTEELRDKGQLILYGPPGTGKTHLAMEVADFLVEQSGSGTHLVQFHPSYAYEDFFEGLRPRVETSEGTVSFAVHKGPLRLLAQEAEGNPSGVYVLVIDEINRANLAKVFGELYFLLEYRDRAVRLQYSPEEEFRLPPNLYVIGTMNTADRSIAMVDAAMRRRFTWMGLFPGEPPVDGMLRRWLAANDIPLDRADLLDALNDQIGDRDAAVGPSYLMTARAASDEGLARIWKHQILPLLEERHMGEVIDMQRTYGLEALRKGTSTPPSQRIRVIEEETGERAS
ncbi:McrB family protein [Nocardia takedensis]